ncbi:Cytoplasmic dynein 1 light intermediate chain 1 [Liparis tanakae]|uniref:Dynein light intermediate chain n=1 Tax=Liparis tanakae TaxID=230148 RepID=A0A4Z2J616_9TELE|nr:Cytoplasmic dynein 1 light intermediate chain 1 [Liparis tanakae]
MDEGEVGSGKTALVAKLQGVEEFMKGRGLEYLYFMDSIGNTLLLITVDMSRPWNALDSLQKWAAVAREHIDKLRVAPETLRELEHRLVKQFQEYTEPGSGEDGTPQRRSDEEESVLLPLGENTLTHNLGIPVVVVCTKIVHEKEIQAEDDQVFLAKLQSLLAKQPAVTAGRPVDTTSRAPTGSPRTSNRSAAANVANAMPQSGQTSEGVLANFFNSLLTKKAGTGGPGTPGGGNNTPGTVRKSGSKLGLSDVQAELDRISSRETDSDLPNANDTPAADGQDT